MVTHELRQGQLPDAEDDIAEVVILEVIGQHAFENNVSESGGSFSSNLVCKTIRRCSPSTT
jgi:hypothetical protein